ncbi:MAG: hypothetical protein WBQ11_08805 [Isosphaeraceae bacterium]
MTMPLPFVIDNLAHRLVDTLNDLLGQSAGKPLDIATAYFSISPSSGDTIPNSEKIVESRCGAVV